MKPVVKGYLAVLTAAFFWGSQGVVGKKVMLEGFDPLALAAYRTALTSLIFLAGIGLFSPKLLKIDLKDLPFFLVFGLVGIGLFHFSYNYAIYYAGVSTAVMLLYTAPTFVAIISALFLKEPLTVPKIVAIILTLLGCITLSWSGKEDLSFSLLGIFFGVLTGLTYALWNVLCKKAVSKYSPWTVNLYSITAGSLSLLLLAAPRKVLLLDWQPEFVEALFLMAVANTILPDTFYAYGMKFLEASKASILANGELLIAVILAVLVLDEPFTLRKLLGLLAIIGAISLLVYEDVRKNQLSSNSVPMAEESSGF